MPKDFYGILQVSKSASQEVIKAAYDVSSKSVEIEQAYSVLSDAEKKKEYDKANKTIGNYRIISLLATGGYAKTYIGEHILTGKRVCIKHCKKLAPEYQKILIEEWNTLCDLAHYELPGMRDLVALDDGTLALVMQYIPGLTLQQLVEKHGRLDAEDAAWICERLFNALKYLHHHGVIHGDIKPQNVIVREENHTIVLIDFGLALVKPGSSTVAKGHTDIYAPPEQVARKTLVPESDFYSLGMTMIYALSGKLKCVEGKELPADVPEAFRKFIGRLVKKEVAARPRWKTVIGGVPTGEDLCETIKQVRMQAFRRTESRMKQIADRK